MLIKGQNDSAHVSMTETRPKIRALKETRRLLMDGIDCIVPKYLPDSASLTIPSTSIPTQAGQLLAWDSGQGHGQHDDAAPPNRLSTKTLNLPSNEGDHAEAAPISSSCDTGVVIDAILHNDAQTSSNVLFPHRASPPVPADANWCFVQDLAMAHSSSDPFHDNWPHW